MKRYAGIEDRGGLYLTQFWAILVAAFFIALVIYGLYVCRPLPNADDNKTSGADMKCYQAIAARIHAGENYYAAAAHELRRTGYATGSVFNWRLPFFALFLGSLPRIGIAQVLAFLLATIALYLWLKVLLKEGFSKLQIAVGGLILSGAVVYSFIPGPFLMHEFWAGLLIMLSLAVYAKSWRYISALIGLIALFLRELTLPFAFVMLVLAYYEGKRREALLWLAGISVFGLVFMNHWHIVSGLITKEDRLLQGGWIAFGGWPFVLNTQQIHPFLILLPSWTSAIVLPVALIGTLGLFRRQRPAETRLGCTIGIYILVFTVVGRPFNTYWGLMCVFLMPIGLLYAPNEIRNLWQCISRSRSRIGGNGESLENTSLE